MGAHLHPYAGHGERCGVPELPQEDVRRAWITWLKAESRAQTPGATSCGSRHRSQEVMFPTDRTGRRKAPGGAVGPLLLFLVSASGPRVCGEAGIGFDGLKSISSHARLS